MGMLRADDAKYLAREFAPTFDKLDSVNLPNYLMKFVGEIRKNSPFEAGMKHY